MWTRTCLPIAAVGKCSFTPGLLGDGGASLEGDVHDAAIVDRTPTDGDGTGDTTGITRAGVTSTMRPPR